MATFPKPSDILDQYKITLKALRPDINVEDPSSEPLIRGRVSTGILSGAYGDMQKVDDDTFIQDGRGEALDRWGTSLNLSRQPATPAQSPDVLITGIPGTIFPAGTLFKYNPTGLLYSQVSAITIDGLGNGHAAIVAQSTGSLGNLPAGTVLTVMNPPVGGNATATLVAAISDGAEIETNDSYRSRLLNRLQRPPSGGNQFDYPQFAFLADPSIRSALINRFGRGLGTVDIYVTTGTTDIDTAITQGLPITRVPTLTVINIVQAYYDAHAPLTDCPKVFAPTEVSQDVTVKVDLAPGILLTTVPSDPTFNPLNLTTLQLIRREISRVLYKVPVGGRHLPGFIPGFIVASDIEHQLDVMLSAVTDNTGLSVGHIPLLVDRQCQNLDGVNVNKSLLANQLALPGTLTVVLGV